MTTWYVTVLIALGIIVEVLCLIHQFIWSSNKFWYPKTANLYDFVFPGLYNIIDVLTNEAHFTIGVVIIGCTIYQIFALPGTILRLIALAMRRLIIKKGY